MARYPVDSIHLASGYGYRLVRGAQQGHWGYDLSGDEGTSVKAPEPMTVTRVWLDDKTPPFVGYGPGGVEALGRSGVYHLLAHLDPSTIPVEVGESVWEGESVGQMSSLRHVHWEVRQQEIDSPSTREGNTIVPLAWMTAVNAGWTAAQGTPLKIARGPSGLLWLALILLIARSKR